jgi:hypothetical protein
MNFWDLHKNALSVAGLGLFVLLVGYLAVIRPSGSEAEACGQEIAKNEKQLAEYYLALKNENNALRYPTIQTVRRDCERRYEEYGGQLKDLKARLRFPFEDNEFKYATVPAGELPGIYLIQRSTIVARNVETGSLQAETQLEQDWLGFAPSVTPDKVTKAKAEEELRKLCLAEQVTLLAIKAGISRVIKVRPLDKTEEAATRLMPNPKFKPGGAQPEKIAVEHSNRFIVNYPVSVEMIGSIDSVMRFFHSVRQEKRFLVIRSFQIVNQEGLPPNTNLSGKMRPGEVYVTISAACMDFKEGEVQAKPKPTWVPPSGPIGA